MRIEFYKPLVNAVNDLKILLPAGGTTISGGSQLLIGKLGTICVHVTKKVYRYHLSRTVRDRDVPWPVRFVQSGAS